jgi:O-antigen chain-terminating methyltransferase
MLTQNDITIEKIKERIKGILLAENNKLSAGINDGNKNSVSMLTSSSSHRTLKERMIKIFINYGLRQKNLIKKFPVLGSTSKKFYYWLLNRQLVNQDNLPEYLLSLENNDIFLRETYEKILGRMPDEHGFNYYMGKLVEGVPKELVLYRIVNSSEARSKKVKIKFRPKLTFEVFLSILKLAVKKIPLLSTLILWPYRLVKLPFRFHQLSEHFRITLSEMEGIKNKINAMSNDSQSTKTELENLCQHFRNIISETEGIKNKINAMSNDSQGTKTELENLCQRLSIALTEIEGIKNQINSPSSVPDINDTLITEGCTADSYKSKTLENSIPTVHKMQDKNDGDTFYFLLENLFRGSMEDIKSRQSIYLPYVTEAYANSIGKFFLDAGCGRGEFLTLLQEHGIPAKGVDINRLTTDLVKKVGIDAVLSDVLEYLNVLEDNSLIGLSMFQVIEHLNFKHLNSILKTAFKKIAINGIIILESVNPHCPIAFGNFYLDPTHTRPYPPNLMKFMLEWHGFENVKTIYSSPIPKHLYFKEPVMNYQAYAVLGKKTKL